MPKYRRLPRFTEGTNKQIDLAESIRAEYVYHWDFTKSGLSGVRARCEEACIARPANASQYHEILAAIEAKVAAICQITSTREWIDREMRGCTIAELRKEVGDLPKDVFDAPNSPLGTD